MTAAQKFAELLPQADIVVNGARPWDLQVNDERLYSRLLRGGSLALGEAYMDGWWDAEDLVTATAKLVSSPLYNRLVDWEAMFLALKARFFNLQNVARAHVVAEAHYDLGNDLYEATLGPYLQYTANVWRDGARNQAEAEKAKLKYICETLGLRPGQRVLDIGCGWGGFARYAIEHYGVTVVGLSVSKEQQRYVQEHYPELPFTYVVEDYRNYKDTEGFDHIISIEMIEHVGPKNYPAFFAKVDKLLKPNGKFFLQAISYLGETTTADPWLNKYIFPNGILPTLVQLERAARPFLIIDTVNNIGQDYEFTLTAWWHSFADKYADLKSANPKYDERFYRMWRYYLLTCAGLFRARVIQDWQICFSKNHLGNPTTTAKSYL